MLEYMENVSQSEAENIRKTIQDLFRQTCILQTKCDPVTLIQKDNPHYQVCARNREFIADYLQVLDCELVHDPQEHIFRITGDGVLTERMTLLTTKLVILEIDLSGPLSKSSATAYEITAMIAARMKAIISI